jgi:hypothetical protein
MMLKMDAVASGTGKGAMDSHHRARMILAKVVSISALIKKQIRNDVSDGPLPRSLSIEQQNHNPRYALMNVAAIVPSILAMDVTIFGTTVAEF